MATREAQITVEFTRLACRLADLEKLSLELEERLKIVTRDSVKQQEPPQPTPTGKIQEEQKEEQKAPLAADLFGLSIHVEDVVGRMRGILDRLEL